MPRFLVLYSSSATVAEQLANSDAAQREAGMALWDRWHERARDAVIDLGTPLTSVRRIPAGAGSGSGKHVSGYSILDAASADEAAELLSDHPHLHAPAAEIELLEMLRTPKGDQ